ISSQTKMAVPNVTIPQSSETSVHSSDIHNGIRLCSFNCRSVKNCIPVIRELCDNHDILLLQEHWLLPNELNLLGAIHPQFLSIGLSAVDISNNILLGRPFGGTAILFRNDVLCNYSSVDSDDSRITGLEYRSMMGSVLLLNVYMPVAY